MSEFYITANSRFFLTSFLPRSLPLTKPESRTALGYCGEQQRAQYLIRIVLWQINLIKTVYEIINKQVSSESSNPAPTKEKKIEKHTTYVPKAAGLLMNNLYGFGISVPRSHLAVH